MTLFFTLLEELFVQIAYKLIDLNLDSLFSLDLAGVETLMEP